MAELFGGGVADTDRFLRTIGWRRTAAMAHSREAVLDRATDTLQLRPAG